MILRIAVVFLTLSLIACSRTQDTGAGKGRLYSYVDAQGNLVTVERSPEGKSAGKASPGDDVRPSDGQAGGEERYQTPEEVDKKLEEQKRDRFVTYRGPEGDIITRPLDLVAEREAREKKPGPYEAVDPGEEYIETVSRVPADCCLHALEQAGLIEPGDEHRALFGPGRGSWIRLDVARPAVVLKLSPSLGKLVLRSFVHEDAYLSPRLLLLDSKGMPVLKVDNLFTRRYPENWYRFGYFEGELPLGPAHAYVVLYLPYGIREEEGAVRADGSLAGVVEDGARPALEGELVVGGKAGPRREAPEDTGNQTRR